MKQWYRLLAAGLALALLTGCAGGAAPSGQAAQPIVSENYSVHNWERIKETRKYSLWTAAVILFPNTFVKIFMSPTDSVLQIAPGIMQIYGLAYLLLPLNIFATYYFQSVMQPKTALIVSI